MKFSLVPINTWNIEVLKVLVEKCFPLTYSEQLYQKIAVNYGLTSQLCYLNDIPVGGIASRIEDFFEEGEEKYNLHIMIIIVLKPYRKLGIGKILMNWLYNQANQLQIKIEKIDLHVLKNNTAAVQFYLKENFIVEEELQDYYDIEDIDNTALYMTKKYYFN